MQLVEAAKEILLEEEVILVDKEEINSVQKFVHVLIVIIQNLIKEESLVEKRNALSVEH